MNEYLETKDPYTTCGMIVLDIDYFKYVNDTFGHLFGDQVLCALADLLRGLFDEDDIVMRFGGDEFIVFIPGPVSEVSLNAKMDRIRSELTAKSREKLGFPATISAGAVITRQGLPEVTELIKMADAALYQSKHGGKNRITIHLLDFETASK